MILELDYPEQVAVVGDIHGRRDLLAALLDRLGNLPVLVMGDVCDRGPDTKGVIDLLIARGARGVRGNHEEWLLRWARRQGFDSSALHAGIGGRATLDSYGCRGTTPREIEAEAWNVPPDHVRWLEGLATAVDLRVAGERYWLVHAGLPGRRDLSHLAPADVVPWLVRHHPLDLLWSCTPPSDVPSVDRTVIMGHVPMDAAEDLGNVIALDSGCGTSDDGSLTAVVLPARRFVVSGG